MEFGSNSGLSKKENKVLISTNATFLEKSYIQEFKSQSKVMLEEIFNSIVSSMIPDVENILINEERLIKQQTLRESYRSQRITIWNYFTIQNIVLLRALC